MPTTEKLSLPITVMIGPPGVGKSTLLSYVNSLGPFACHDGDEFITPEGNLHLTDGSWNDTDRRAYLSAMANFAAQHPQDRRLVLVDAMTKVWMRDHFAHPLGITTLAWVHVTRTFADGEMEELVNFRASQGHPIKDVTVFQRFHHEFEPLEHDHQILKNPGASASIEVFHSRIDKVLANIYGN